MTTNDVVIVAILITLIFWIPTLFLLLRFFPQKNKDRVWLIKIFSILIPIVIIAEIINYKITGNFICIRAC